MSPVVIVIVSTERYFPPLVPAKFRSADGELHSAPALERTRVKGFRVEA